MKIRTVKFRKAISTIVLLIITEPRYCGLSSWGWNFNLLMNVWMAYFRKCFSLFTHDNVVSKPWCFFHTTQNQMLWQMFRLDFFMEQKHTVTRGCQVRKMMKTKTKHCLWIVNICLLYIYIYVCVYILGPYILDTDTILIILALFATRIELKWNNQDLIEVQT